MQYIINILNKSLCILFFFFGLFLILKNNQDLHNLQILFVIFIFVTTTTLIFYSIFQPNNIGELPIIYLFNLYFLICYLGTFFFDKHAIFLHNNITLNDFSLTINYLFLGYFSFLGGYYLTKLLLKNFKRKSFTYLNCSNNEILILGVATLSSTIILFYFFKIQENFAFLAQIKYPLLLFGTGLSFYCLVETKNKNMFFYIFLLLILSIPIILEILSGSFNFPFMIIFLLYIYYSILKKRINLIPFLIIVITFLFIHTGKYEYRSKTWNQTWVNKSIDKSAYEKSKSFVETYFFKKELHAPTNSISKDYFTYQNFTNKIFNINFINRKDNYRLERRVFHSYWSLLIVTKKTPNQIPYWDGYSYKILATKIIPRVFWKEKPSDTLGNEFGHRYNVLTKETKKTNKDLTTSWNMPVLNEFYVNFGKWGIIAGMIFLGIIFCFLTKLFSIKEKNNLESVISFFIFVPLFFMESHLSLLFGAIFQSYFFLLIFSFSSVYILRKL